MYCVVICIVLCVSNSVYMWGVLRSPLHIPSGLCEFVKCFVHELLEGKYLWYYCSFLIGFWQSAHCLHNLKDCHILSASYLRVGNLNSYSVILSISLSLSLPSSPLSSPSPPPIPLSPIQCQALYLFQTLPASMALTLQWPGTLCH